jgi:two-component system, NarL family, sensor histidine kinase BarA
MSYRTFKRLLGETSLERKCRFLFGGGLLLLITGSFYFYGRLTARLVHEQTNIAGRLLMMPIIYEKHWKVFEVDRTFVPVIDELARDVKGQQPKELAEYSWDILKSDTKDPDPAKRPSEPAEFAAYDELLRGASEVVRMNRGRQEYTYYGAVRASQSCIECHAHKGAEAGSLLGMVKIVFPLSPTERSLAWNNAILLATAIATSFLAMLAAWAIVRYVIVKPVLHLKDVSEAVSRGNLDQRADIRTGDEFEELSQAFNRMLRHLVEAQDELRTVNSALDHKVDELAQANLRLFELNNLKNDFLATMTHELRTPLNSILGFSDVLTGADNLSEKQQKYLRNIQVSGKDLLALVNDILDLAKIEAGKMDLHLVDFSIGDLIERVVTMVRLLAEKRNIDISAEVDERLPLLSQDPGKIQQVLYNLVSNAIKFTPEGGRVRVLAEYDEPEGMLVLVVEDTGVGIPLEEQETIFEKFRQGNMSRRGRQGSLTREYAGTGLGLSIVMELSKLLGGTVTVRSEVGKGSVFHVRLPTILHESFSGSPSSVLPSDASALRRMVESSRRPEGASTSANPVAPVPPATAG